MPLVNHFYKWTLMALLLLNTACATTVVHQGCYVADEQLQGVYSGQCQGSKAHGWGKAEGSATGDVYEGEFKEGFLEGKGTYVWSDGDKYIGEFKNSMAEGRGVLIYANGQRAEGRWQKNRLVQ